MVMLALLMSDESAIWEARIGSFMGTCPSCQAHTWQITFNVWRTHGNMLNVSPHAHATAQGYQVRCTACGMACVAGHPSTWVQTLGVVFHPEAYPPTRCMPQYARLLFTR